MSIKIRWLRNKWYLDVYWKGKRKSIAIGTDRNEAEIVKAQLEKSLLIDDAEAFNRIVGADNPGNGPTLGVYGEKWASELSLTNLKASTKVRYLQCFKLHIQPCQIAGKQLNEINYGDVKGFILELKGRYCVSKPKLLSKNSIRNILGALRLILSEAEADGLIKGNPAANKKLSQFYRTAGQNEEINPFTISEVHKIESIFREKFAWYYPLVVCLFRTGIRAGEARGLEWGDVSFKARRIAIKRSHSYGRAVTKPKTTSSRRTINLSNDLVEVLQTWKAHLKEYWLENGCPDPGLVFPGKTGRPFDLPNFQKRYWNKAQELAGVEIRRVHDTRHTFATILLTNSVAITRVAHLLGHSSVRTTLQFYAHYLPDQSSGEDLSAVLDDSEEVCKRFCKRADKKEVKS
jgi:integrase